MLEVRLASMTTALADGARSINNLSIVRGCSTRDAQRKVAELYSPPRATRELGMAGTRKACPTFAAYLAPPCDEYVCNLSTGSYLLVSEVGAYLVVAVVVRVTDPPGWKEGEESGRSRKTLEGDGGCDGGGGMVET